jgi:hypothetical protein
MTGKKKILLIHPFGEQACLPELASALRRVGAELEEVFIGEDYTVLLDALEEDVLPVVVKDNRQTGKA